MYYQEIIVIYKTGDVLWLVEHIMGKLNLPVNKYSSTNLMKVA